MRSFNFMTTTAVCALLFTAPAVAQITEETNSGDEQVEETNYLDIIVVSGTSKPRTQLNSAISVSSIGDDLIEDFNPSSEADLFRLIPGIQVPGGGGPGGNSNIAVRGLPVITGGSPYVGIQEDGLPISLFGDDAFANNDLWTRYDWTTNNIEAIRGGTAGTFASQAPGAILNYISRTGEEQGGAFGVTTGVGFDETQIDFRYGDYLTDDISFHVGGFIRQGEGHKDVGYQIIDSTQVKANLTKELDDGYIRFSGKYANTQEPIYHNSPFLASLDANGDISGISGFANGSQRFDPRDESFHSTQQRSVAFRDTEGGISQREIDGVSSSQSTFGIDIQKEINDTFTFRNNGRIQEISGSFANSWGNGGYRVADGSALDQYATGANFGSNVAAGTVIQSQQTVFVDTDDYGSFVNDMSLTGAFDLGGAELTAKAGYFYFSQSVDQAWHVNNHNRIVDGSDTDLVNSFDATGTQLTVAGANGYNAGWGGFSPQYQYDINNKAPYLALDLETDVFVIDASVRQDTVTTQGFRAGTRTTDAPVTVTDPATSNDVEISVATPGQGARQNVNFETEKTNWTIGGLWKATDGLSVFARASEAFRHNSYRRLGNTAEFTGNGDLDPASRVSFTDPVKQYELGIKNRGGFGDFDYTVDLTLLQAEFTQNAIETNPVICGPITGGPSCVLPTTIESQGFEFFGTAGWGNLNVVANATFTDAEDDEGNPIARVPDLTYTINASYDFMDNLGVNFGASGNTEVLTSTGGHEEGSVIFNAGIDYSPLDGITLGLQAYNLTDELVFRGNDVSDTGVDVNGRDLLTGIPLDGRTIRVSLRYDF